MQLSRHTFRWMLVLTAVGSVGCLPARQMIVADTTPAARHPMQPVVELADSAKPSNLAQRNVPAKLAAGTSSRSATGESIKPVQLGLKKSDARAASKLAVSDSPAVVTPATTHLAATLPAVKLPAVNLPAVSLAAMHLPAVNLPAVDLPAVPAPKVGELGVDSVAIADRPSSDSLAHTVAHSSAQTPTHPTAHSTAHSTAQTPAMSLEQFETIALSNNPTLRGMAATTQKAAGFRTQVSLRANPSVGYQAMQLADEGTDQHVAFIEQEIVTGGKLALNRRVLNEAVQAQLHELETQRVRVLSDVRSKYYEALAAQQRIELIHVFQSVADKGFELAELRKAALEGSQIDVLQAKVQKNEIDLAYQQAQIAFQAAWKELAALAGVADLSPGQLTGQLPQAEELLDWQSVSASILSSSPELQAAQSRVRQARALLDRHGVQAIPNLTMQLGAGVDSATDSGMINVQVGAPIPVFNQNQGNIAAARAEYCRALMDVERIENSIAARLAAVSQNYQSAAIAVKKYSQDILPNADESMGLAEIAYKAGETNFTQVLIARRTYFDTTLQFIAAQTQLAQARARVDGFVLTGGLDPMNDQSGDDSLRGLTFGQQ